MIQASELRLGNYIKQAHATIRVIGVGIEYCIFVWHRL